MGLADVFASIDAHNRDIVESQTWGHLAPEPGKVYQGTIVFACAAYAGDIAYLSIDFKLKDGTPLLDNPWSFEDLTDYVCEWVCDCANGWRDRKPFPKRETDGKVFRFTGTYTRYKNNTRRITGSFQELTIR